MRRRVKLENLLLDESLRLLQLADLHLQDTGNKEYDSMCWSQANMPSYLRAPPRKPSSAFVCSGRCHMVRQAAQGGCNPHCVVWRNGWRTVGGAMIGVRQCAPEMQATLTEVDQQAAWCRSRMSVLYHGAPTVAAPDVGPDGGKQPPCSTVQQPF